MKLSCSPVCGDIFFDRTISNCIRSAIANWSKTLANDWESLASQLIMFYRVIQERRDTNPSWNRMKTNGGSEKEIEIEILKEIQLGKIGNLVQ